MEEMNIHSIEERFDQFDEASLQTKKTQKAILQSTDNQFQIYFQNMQNKLKLKTLTQDQKFQQILTPMKKLKSFVNIKDFLRGLNNKPQKKTNGFQTVSQQTKRRLQYQDLRGGVYMEKVENHLKRKNMKRRIDDQAEMLLKQLEDNHSNNDCGKWMENALSKISLKQETFLKINEQKDTYLKGSMDTQKLTIFEDFTNREKRNNLNNSKMQNYRNRRNEKSQQKNFKKVSDFLTERLRRLLTDKYVNNLSKSNKKARDLMTDYSNVQYISSCRTMTQPSASTITSKRPLSRASCRSKKWSDMKSFQSRAQTSESKNRGMNDDQNWRTNVTNRMQQLVSSTTTYEKKCQQDRKQYKSIVNPFCEIQCDKKS